MREERKHYRPSWDDYFMAIVKVVASRSSCDRLYSGAILVKDNRIVATGYNGSPPGIRHCDDSGHLMEEGHCVRTVHSELNVLLQAAIQGGASTTGSIMYTKYSPCIHCAKYIIACGVKKVVVAKVYRNAETPAFLRSAGVEVVEYKENPEWRAELVQMFSEAIPERVNEGEIKLAGKN